MEAHDFIKREYWIDNLDKVKKCSQIQQFTCIIDNQIVGFDLYEQYIAGLFITDNYRNKGIGRFYWKD